MTSDNDILPNASVRIRQAGRNLKSVLRPVDDAAAAGGLISQRAAPRSITVLSAHCSAGCWPLLVSLRWNLVTCNSWRQWPGPGAWQLRTSAHSPTAHHTPQDNRNNQIQIRHTEKSKTAYDNIQKGWHSSFEFWLYFIFFFSRHISRIFYIFFMELRFNRHHHQILQSVWPDRDCIIPLQTLHYLHHQGHELGVPALGDRLDELLHHRG